MTKLLVILSVAISFFLLDGRVAAQGLSDPLWSEGTVPTTPLGEYASVNDQNPCTVLNLHYMLSLQVVVEQVLCNHPQTRQAWAESKFQAAQLGLSKSAFLPTIGALQSHVRASGESYLSGSTFPHVIGSQTLDSKSLSLRYLLFDFGARGFNLEGARELLAAAYANHNNVIQSTFVLAAVSYYDVIASRESLKAVRETESSAFANYEAASAKVRLNVGTLAEQSQSKAAWAQAKLAVVKALGLASTTAGTLALQMGLPAMTPLLLEPQRRPESLADSRLSIDDLLRAAQDSSPLLVAARAKVRAAEAKVNATIAEGLPTLTLKLGRSWNRQTPNYDGQIIVPHSQSLGLELSLPLFEGFSRTYQVKTALAQVEIQQVALANVELQVSLAVWNSHQELINAIEATDASEYFVLGAEDSADRSQRRYTEGVGTLIDVLSSQVILTNARQQQVSALSTWNTARIRFLSNLGTLGVWAIK